MVALYSYDPEFGITGGDEDRATTRRHLIVFTSDEERTEIPMDLTREEAQFLVALAQQVNAKAKWSADIRMALNDSTAPTGEVA